MRVPARAAMIGCSKIFSPRYPRGSVALKLDFGSYVFHSGLPPSIELSTRSKLPAPVTCMRRVSGSPVDLLFDEISVLILNDPTAPPKSGGLPFAGRGSTL